MSHRNHVVSSLALLVLLGAGPILSAQAEPRVGETMRAVSMHWSKRSPEDIAQRIGFAANLVAGREVKADLAAMLIKDQDAFRRWTAPIEDAPELKVKVIPDYDEIRVINRSLLDKVVEKDIGKVNAIDIAYRYLQQLAEAGMLNQNRFDASDVQVGYGRVIEGSKDGKQKLDAITEYRVTFRPNIDGIQLANAGVRIAVHRSGGLAGLRFGGVSTDENANDTVLRTVSLNQANGLMIKLFPDNATPEVVWSRVMYVMPEDTRVAVVAPMQVYSYALKTKSDGEEIVSRRIIVGVSLSNGKIVDFTAPALKHGGQTPNRKEAL